MAAARSASARSSANTDDPTARVSIYIPTGYQVDTTTGVGTKLGDVTATAAAADLGGAVLPLTGELDVAAPDAASAAQCRRHRRRRRGTSS